DVEIVELAGRAVALEGARIGLDPGTLEQPAELGDVVVRHLLLDAVRPQALDLALDVDLRLVDRIPQALAGIAADDEAAGLGHEGAEMADGAADHDIDALHGDAAAGRGITLDDQQPAMARGAGGLAGIAFDPDLAGHDVLGDAD